LRSRSARVHFGRVGVETIPSGDVQTAFERLERNDVRYRFTLVGRRVTEGLTHGAPT
jgi:hypothetical protein